MKRREKILDDIIEGIADSYGNACTENCFRILYRLPTELQIRLACFMMARYLPIFERKYPNITVPRQILSDISNYAAQFGRAVNMRDVESFTAEVSYIRSCDGVLLAYSHPEDPFTVTSSCACAVESVINARRRNVWEADDPEAWEMTKQRKCGIAERNHIHNAAALGVFAREWTEVVEWLRREEVWTYPDDVNLEGMERQLDYWVDNMMVLIVPEIAALMSEEFDESDADIISEREGQ